MAQGEVLKTDVLIVGGGIAGIRAAIECHKNGVDVTLMTKGAFGKDGAAVWMAGWGYQVALYPPDSIEQHVKDAIIGGKFLNNQELVHEFLSLAPETVKELDKWGMRLAKKEGKYVQIRMPGHSYPRSLQHAKLGELLGGEYRKALPRQVRRRKEIRVLEDSTVVDLLKVNNTVVGAVALDMRDGELKVIEAKTTILATGGFMGCFEFTTANPTLVGDGHGLAYRAGARMVDMEFIQFMPTTSVWPLSVRRDLFPYSLLNILHGYFYNKNGERFMERYYPKERDFATREAQGRAIFREVREGRGSPHGGAYLSFKHLPNNLLDEVLKALKDNPFILGLKQDGIDLKEDGIEVAPAAHYIQGGCWINKRCETSLDGLYAIGEIGSGGKDGADRLAGNSLPFCMAMGIVAGREASARARKSGAAKVSKAQIKEVTTQALAPLKRSDGVRAQAVKQTIRKLMSTYMVFERTGNELKTALKEIEKLRAEALSNLWVKNKTKRLNMDWLDAVEAGNMVDVAEMAMRAALMREESRGLHERADFPEKDPKWLKHIVMESKEGKMALSTEPVAFPYLKPEEG